VPHPLVIGYHLIWTAYGWWLPNDPRGSGSHTIADSLSELGDIHHGRKAIQPTGREIRQFYERAAELLQHELLTFTEIERAIIAEAFGDVIERERYTCYACAVMPDHAHILIRKHRDTAEEMAGKLMEVSRLKLVATGHRVPSHPTWLIGPAWSVFLEHPTDIHRTIGYIERNPIKIRLPPQKWPFVQPYNNWPLHAGHSPKSPYVKRLREVGRYP